MKELKLDLREMNKLYQERFNGQDLITLDELLGDYEDLISEVERLEREIKDMEQDIEDNYEPKKEDYGVYDRDFI